MPATIQRRRALLALATVLATFVALVVPLISHAIAQGAPKIEIINPSSYSDDGVDQTPLFVSNLETGNDEAEEEHETTYRLNAWTKNTPAEALVEFELEIGAGQNITLGTADRVAEDTFEYNWDINVTDGTYTVRAILYEGNGIFAEEVSRSERDIIINNGNPTPDPTPTIDILYPPNGGQAGVHTNPLTGATNILVDLEWSSDTDNLQVFYTLSDPGDDPVWKVCVDFPNFSGMSGRFACNLESQDQGGKSVTGIAAQVNDDDSGNGNPALNGSGDSVRIFPYEQVPTTFDIDRDTTRTNSDDGDWLDVCSANQAVVVNDQLGRPIGSMNIDVHASGPNDQLKFFAGGIPLIVGPPSGNSPPDKGGHGTELGYLCGFSDQIDFTGDQGDHNRVGVPDIKHVEGNTGGSGTFAVSLHADTKGETFLTFWVDSDNDDEYCSQELALAASIGWDSPAPPPSLEAPDKDICPIPTPPPPGATPTATGSPTPSPSSSGPPDPRGCTVTGTDGNDKLRGTEGDDVICGLGGDDQITALSGNDTVYGDDGDDQLDGGAGDDALQGGAGNDGLAGRGGRDAMSGGSESDILIGGGGDDTLNGNGKSDSLVGEGGRDIINGGASGDVLTGGKGDDVLKAGKGKDDVEGGNGADTMKGGPANDRMDGQGGPDTMNGGGGKDRCVGGPGRDRQTSC